MAATTDDSGDRVLLARCQIGNPHDWFELFQQHDHALTQGVRRALGPCRYDRERIDDLVQFVRAEVACHPDVLTSYVESRASLDAYLAGVAYHIARHELTVRPQKRQPVYLDPDKLPERPTFDEDQAIELEDLSTRLTPGERAYLDDQCPGETSSAPRRDYSEDSQRQWQCHIARKLNQLRNEEA
jgi:hypothetical protein